VSKNFRYIPYTRSQRRHLNANPATTNFDNSPPFVPFYQLPTALNSEYNVHDSGHTPDYVLHAQSPGLLRARKRNRRNERIARKEREEQTALEREEEEFDPNDRRTPTPVPTISDHNLDLVPTRVIGERLQRLLDINIERLQEAIASSSSTVQVPSPVINSPPSVCNSRFGSPNLLHPQTIPSYVEPEATPPHCICDTCKRYQT